MCSEDWGFVGWEVGIAMAGQRLPSVIWLLGPEPSNVLSLESFGRFETHAYLLGSKSPSAFRFKGILIRESVPN